jgi:hypothetical protein
MMPKWMGTGSSAKDAATAGDEELRMIPRWSMVLAVVLFAGMQYIFHVVMPHHKHELLPLRLMMGYAWGSLFASYALLLGYVSCDVKRRRVELARWCTSCCGNRCCRAARIARRRWRRVTTTVRSASFRWRRCVGIAIAG